MDKAKQKEFLNIPPLQSIKTNLLKNSFKFSKGKERMSLMESLSNIRVGTLNTNIEKPKNENSQSKNINLQTLISKNPDVKSLNNQNKYSSVNLNAQKTESLNKEKNYSNSIIKNINRVTSLNNNITKSLNFNKFGFLNKPPSKDNKIPKQTTIGNKNINILGKNKLSFRTNDKNFQNNEGNNVVFKSKYYALGNKIIPKLKAFNQSKF